MYDPCGGWGHRLLGAYKNNITYIYNDFWEKTYTGVQSIGQFLKYKNVTYYNEDCSRYTPPEFYDTVFTCPPYYNTEIYNNKRYKNIDDYKLWWGKVIEHSLKPSVKYFAFVIGKKYKDMLISVTKNYRLKLFKEIGIGTLSQKNNFLTNTPATGYREYLIVFTHES